MPRKPDTPCSRCGKLLWSGTTSLPASDRTCRECRTVPRPSCRTCSQPCARTSQIFCSLACHGRSRIVADSIKSASRSASSARWRSRIANAGGLSHRQQRRLRDAWISQGRPCAYCGGSCESIDHVVPLARGGTSFEGNLAPACLTCNQAKGQRLLAEWRYATAAVAA